MLSVIIKYLIAKLETFEYLDKVHGLSTIVQVGDESMPAVYSGNELVHVNFDSYDSLVYIQQNGKVGRETTEHPAIACKYNVVERYPFRLIVYSQGKENINCESYSQQIADSIKAALNGKQQTLETAANLTNATIILGDTDLDKNSVWQTQFSSPNQLKDSDILIAIDLEFEIEGDDTCFANNPCENSEFVFDLATQTFCERVDECLDIPTTNGNYVLNILNGVKSWVAAASSATWGSITGTLSDQTDLNTALSNKANASDLTAHTSNTSNPHSVTATQVDALKRDGSNANSDIDLGAYKLNAQSLGVKGVNGAGHVGLKHQASNATASANETSLFAGSDGELYYKNDGNSVVQIATRAWVTAQGYITNVITSLGYTPENVANKTTTIAGNESSTTLYANVKGLVDWIKQGLTALLSSLGLTKTTPVDADSLLLNDSADSNKLKLLSWANLKATLNTYFDTIYSKKNVLVNTTETTVQGTSVETVVASFDISNWLKAGDGFEVSTFATKNLQTAGDTWGMRYLLNTTNNLSGSPVELFDTGGAAATVRTVSYLRQAYTVRNNTTIQAFGTTTSQAVDYINNVTAVMASITVPNVTGTLYLLVTLRHTTATNTDTLTHRKSRVERHEL